MSGTVTTEVSTARSGAILASSARRPAWRSTRQTSAAAPRTESADPFRPRVGILPAPRITPPDTSTTSVVALPTSTPSITVNGGDRSNLLNGPDPFSLLNGEVPWVRVTR